MNKIQTLVKICILRYCISYISKSRVKFIANFYPNRAIESFIMSNNLTHSQSFKSLSRDIQPAWANRFRKDVNDLAYDPKDLREIEYVKKPLGNDKSQDRLRRSAEFSPMKTPIQKYNSTFNTTGGLSKTTTGMKRQMSTMIPSYESRRRQVQIFYSDSNRQVNPQLSSLKRNIYKNESLLRSTDAMMKRSESMPRVSGKVQIRNSSSNYGMGEFEFATKTIEGKIHSKYGHSLSLSKSKTQKVNFAQTIYYDKSEDILLHQHEKRRKMEGLQKYRNFKSYSPHKLYQQDSKSGKRGPLDKFYNVTDKQLDLVRVKCSMVLDLQKITPHPGILKKLGTNLEYPQFYTQISKSNTHRPLYDIQRQERNLVIPKQVISNTRGTYR